jgi:glycerol uptake operon antiterminator
MNQLIIPAARTIKDFEVLLKKEEFTSIILLESHVGQLQTLINLAKKQGKKVILHSDMVQGLKNDEAGAQFLCQVVKPDGLISTHSNVITTAKKNGLLAIQRVFLLDSHSLERSYRVLETSKPDYLEVLPGVMPEIIKEVKEHTKLPIIAGGFIRTQEDIDIILASGATAVTTSHRELWKLVRTGLKLG